MVQNLWNDKANYLQKDTDFSLDLTFGTARVDMIVMPKEHEKQ